MFFINKISIDLLPNEILIEIIEYLIILSHYKHAVSIKTVCKRWNFLIQHVIKTTISNILVNNLLLEITISKFPIKSVRFIDELNVQLCDSFSLQDGYIFTIFNTLKLMEDLKDIQLCFKRKIPVNYTHINEQTYKLDKEFNTKWKIFKKKTSGKFNNSIIFYKLNLLTSELLRGDRKSTRLNSSNLIVFYVSLNKFLWLIDF